MSLVVMKFGGTSVEDPAAINRTATIVAGRVAAGKHPVVVVSAMARVTDQLLRCAAAASQGDRTGALAISSRLRSRHRDTAAALLKDPKQSAELVNWVDQKFDQLDEVLRGLAAILELTPRISDLIVSYGERLSSRMIAHAFCERGIDAAPLDSREVVITDSQYQKAIPIDAIIEMRAAEKIRPLIDSGKVPVMGGFIGANEAGITTTLGRGGSDFTGALIGGAMHADAIEIWTDVDGIMTSDPRVCPDALRVKVISFEEAAELAYFGAKVLHPATILPAVKKNIPVLVLNSKNPTNEGTRIISLAPHCKSPFKSIAVKKKLSIIDVVASRMLMTHGYLREIFTIFDKHQTAVDMVSTSEVSVSLTVDSTDKLPAIAADLSKLADVKYEGKKALICLVGEDIRGQNGMAAQVFNAVRHINVRMISQGASEINMSFMIDEEDADEAVRSLHAAFFQDPDPAVFDVEARKPALTS
ncbi:lysine-sensitive aspartokinase 3 [Occallatibacter riparius]|uniref:Aspartokinase n=1 Tax=Occallatibacter riparius TaxID=1002689 RepID=A0A9J7BM50_9BACT|nr:lysine-sensitive aspartokinase 3 [Occallatibacter riparius]UWZ83816.1 lysine-sensitive aspartokinase 3 [Occallatibacter riparius]